MEGTVKSITDMLPEGLIGDGLKDAYASAIERILGEGGSDNRILVVLATVMVTQGMIFFAFAIPFGAWLYCGGWKNYIIPLFLDDGQAELDDEVNQEVTQVLQSALKKAGIKDLKKAAGMASPGVDGATPTPAARRSTRSSNKKDD